MLIITASGLLEELVLLQAYFELVKMTLVKINILFENKIN